MGILSQLLPSPPLHTTTSHRCLPHVTVLVLLAAAARARFVAADAVATVADRLQLFPLFATGGYGLLLIVGRRGADAGRSFLNCRANRPERLLKPLGFFHAEDVVGDLVLHALPHRLEFLHALFLVLNLRVHLPHATQPDARTQMVHRVEVVLPRSVQLAQQQAALHPAHLRAIALVERVP